MELTAATSPPSCAPPPRAKLSQPPPPAPHDLLITPGYDLPPKTDSSKFIAQLQGAKKKQSSLLLFGIFCPHADICRAVQRSVVLLLLAQLTRPFCPGVSVCTREVCLPVMAVEVFCRTFWQALPLSSCLAGRHASEADGCCRLRTRARRYPWNSRRLAAAVVGNGVGDLSIRSSLPRLPSPTLSVSTPPFFFLNSPSE